MTLRASNRIATLTRARKRHRCNHCHLSIMPGEDYYSVVLGGAGLSSLKFPDRVHEVCLDPFLQTSAQKAPDFSPGE